MGGSPAFDVPQYWQRADGFMPTFIAHAESRHRVMFVLEHFDTAAFAPISGVMQSRAVKIVLNTFILSRTWSRLLYQKKATVAKNIFQVAIDNVKNLSIIYSET